MKRDIVSAYVHMSCDTHPPPVCSCTRTCILDYSLPPLLTYILNGWPISQPKYKISNKNIQILYSLKYDIQKNK